MPLNPGRSTWYTKYYLGDDAITLLNTNWGQGVDPTNYAYAQLWQGSVAARVGTIVATELVDANGSPLVGATVQISTDQGDVYNLTTNTLGDLGLPVIQFGIDKAEPLGAPMTLDNRTTTTITVTGYAPITLSNTMLLAQPTGTVLKLNLGGLSVINHAPSGTNKSISMTAGGTYTFATADFGFSDPQDSPPNALLAVKITTLSTAGSLTDSGSAVAAGQFVTAADIAAGLLKFTPSAGGLWVPLCHVHLPGRR